jgi:hypothetical protein
MQDPKFIITDETLEKCTKFANESVGTSTDKYAKRNQYDVAKIASDIRNGKIAEECVWQKLKDLYPNLSAPDYNIYTKKDKSWDPDLKDLGVPLRVAVKSQEIKSEIAFGRSWVFQFGNGNKFDCDTGIFGKPDASHYVSFVSLNVPKRNGELRAVVKVQWLHDKKLFKAMKKQSLQGNKVAVYYEDLEKFKDELWQL